MEKMSTNVAMFFYFLDVLSPDLNWLIEEILSQAKHSVYLLT